jgi:heme A synthase
LRGFAWLVAFLNFFLLIAGPWTGPSRAMILGLGVLVLALTLWLWTRTSEPMLRWLCLGALGTTGLACCFDPFSVAYACLMPTSFCLLVSVAVLSWSPVVSERHVSKNTARIRSLSLLTAFFVVWQVVAGAFVRHTGQGLHAHFLGAVLVVVHALLLMRRLGAEPEQRPELRDLSRMLVALLGIQVVLGYFAWRAPITPVTTTHVANGALIYATAVLLAVQSFRLLLPPLVKENL